ncbi:MAG: antibiotic biosynthesis monooxygenase [Chloroflexi bacterium CFX4]|nr:antibiotic biosynthesis monooxygenase [Chloroflexi bacterium CFX4]MDL1921084.1 antibiotic biosynthesis monooxygenase [Chloroflexi bacterium CFX3]
MFGLFGKLKAQDGQRDALIQHLLHAADALRQMESCYLYVISADSSDPNGIWVMEAWRSQADHQASLSLATIQQIIAVARPLIAGMGERFELHPIGGKGLVQGQ